jgi:hypothetical protein
MVSMFIRNLVLFSFFLSSESPLPVLFFIQSLLPPPKSSDTAKFLRVTYIVCHRCFPLVVFQSNVVHWVLQLRQDFCLPSASFTHDELDSFSLHAYCNAPSLEFCFSHSAFPPCCCEAHSCSAFRCAGLCDESSTLRCHRNLFMSAHAGFPATRVTCKNMTRH